MLRCRSALLVVAVFAFLAGPLSAQTTATPDTEAPVTTLKLNVRTVLVDVVVTDKNNRAVPGLQKEDFQVSEDGKPQTISFFEPHFAAAASADNATPAPALPPNTFTNVPAVTPNDTVNVLMMDALNTQMADQAYVHKQIVRYLATIPPGIRVGIFLLSERLRIIQGFTQDSAVLRASIARLASNPAPSALLSTPAEASAQNAATTMIQEQATETGSAQLADTAAALQSFLNQEASFENNERTVMTLDALQQIARYLTGVPGRKNLIWFAGAIPLCFPAHTNGQEGCPYEEKLDKTISMLADARVSIYPIGATGLQTNTLYDAGQPQSHTSSFQALNAEQVGSLLSDQGTFAFSNIMMDRWAQGTGGRAVHDSNALKEALADDIENGSRYYTIAYTPTNRSEVGKERTIAIQSVSGNYKLAYHRSYFEDTPKEQRAAEAAPAKDPLRPLMDRGMPDFTELRYRMKVVPATPQPAADTAHAGDNPALSGALTRYTVSFSLAMDGLTLIPGPDGIRRGTIEVALVAYSQEGKPLNWELRSINLAIRPGQLTIAQTSGIPFHFDIDSPSGDVYLRTGIYDASSSKAGTLEIPLRTLAVAAR